MRKGEWFEAEFSKKIEGIPFLISPKLLRSFGLGQVDCATLVKNKSKKEIILYELKYKVYPSRSQLFRLKKTQDFLSRQLDIYIKLEIKFCQRGNDSLF
jgi:hypothetical protein